MKPAIESETDYLLAAQNNLMKARNLEENAIVKSTIHAAMQIVTEIMRMKASLSLMRRPVSNTEGLCCDTSNTPNCEEAAKI